MGITRRVVARFGSRASLLVVVKATIFIVVLAYATGISVTTTSYQAEIGSAVKVANGLLAIDKGFSIALVPSTGTSCSSPVTFGVLPGMANTTITGGHWVYDVQVQSTTSASMPPAGTKFNVTLVLASTTYGPVCIQTPFPSVSGQTIDCKFDVGMTLPPSPYSFKVTVQ
ncbi:hypothetical protein AUF78_15450 [archaeon 13_1_20CM_2_51_12]|nr:MAG: hypothetical protein AUF78_15450 [archaeon 13_1_20CM_2_51_12]